MHVMHVVPAKSRYVSIDLGHVANAYTTIKDQNENLMI
jgi:hypothetical protein